MAETGHIKNVEHFQMLISAVTGFGAAYAPTNNAIKLPALNAALTAANSGIDGVTSSIIPWKVKVNEREDEYAGVGKLSTRVQSAFASCGASKNSVDDLKGFVRQIKGGRAKKLKVDDPATPADESKHNSVSQRSYSQVAEHFDNMIEMCDAETAYNPNEAELKVPALQTKATAMKAANQGVIDTLTPVSNARITRDEALYADDTGIVELAKTVKLYVKSLFGADSPQYKQVSGLQFTKPR